MNSKTRLAARRLSPRSGHRALSALLMGSSFLFLGAFPGWSWESSFFDFFEGSTSARAAAIGGPHSALADDANVLFSNPAGVLSVERQLTVSEVTLNFYESAAEIAGETFFGTPGPAGDRYGTYSLWGPLALSYVNNGRAFGLFSSSNIYLHAWGPSPAARAALEENLVFIGSRAFRFRLPEGSPSSLDIGFSLVAFATLRGVFDSDLRQLILSSTNIQDFLLGSGEFNRTLGAGLEIGLLYSYKKIFAVGLSGRNLAFVLGRKFPTIQDFLSSGSSNAWYNVLPMDISLGFVFRPPLGRLNRFFSDLLFAADYHNIFDFIIYPEGATNPLLHVGVGLEFKLLDIISLRAGYYQCLPSFGLGLDLSLLRLNLAYFGRELSQEPGGHPVGCYTLGVEFIY